nr:hypothetical protein [Tanacetum cinerariifolium]
MATLKFYDTHSMIDYLNKTEGSEGFHQIVDFLNSCHIKFALTKNPTIYTSLIQQFWQTTVANTLDTREIQITATIDGNVKLIIKASIRRYLKLEDFDGISTLPNTEIFKQLSLMGYASNSDKLTFQKGHFSPQWVPTPPYDSPLSGGHTPRSDEGSLTLNELTIMCTTLSNKVESLETELKLTKQTCGVSFTKLIKKVKKLEKTIKTSQARRGAKIVISDDDMVSEDSSKHGRMIEDIDQDAGVILVTPTKVISQEDQPEDQLGVLSAAKILANATRVYTYKNEWENIRARIKSDEKLTQRLQAEEREKYSEDDRTKMLIDLINQRKKFFAQQRDEAKRNKPMTQAQQRTYMSNYIKHIGSYTLKQLKKLSFEEIKELFKATMRMIQDFVLVEREGNKEAFKFVGAGVDDHSSRARMNVEALDDLVQLWSLVKEKFSSTEPNDDKDRVLCVELKRLFKPDADDELWKLQRYMHDLLKWRLYDTCGVHHVST